MFVEPMAWISGRPAPSRSRCKRSEFREIETEWIAAGVNTPRFKRGRLEAANDLVSLDFIL